MFWRRQSAPAVPSTSDSLRLLEATTLNSTSAANWRPVVALQAPGTMGVGGRHGPTLSLVLIGAQRVSFPALDDDTKSERAVPEASVS